MVGGAVGQGLPALDLSIDVPRDLVAQEPCEPRDASRLMVVAPGGLTHDRFWNLVHYMDPGDVLVYNASRVVPAGLRGQRATGGRVSVLVVGARDGGTLCLVRGNTRPGDVLSFGAGQLGVVRRSPPGWICRPIGCTMEDLLQRAGDVQLPPYIHRRPPDMERYQTIYARDPGSLAAPTAGLHFTPRVLTALESRGVRMLPLVLHVGPSTFLPRRSALGDMPPEAVAIPPATAQGINEALAHHRRIFAVGTTTVKAVESMSHDGRAEAGEATSHLLIEPGYHFQIPWAGMVTNFHLPDSTNLSLVAALGGPQRVAEAYRAAVDLRYRFYSFGDAMLLVG